VREDGIGGEAGGFGGEGRHGDWERVEVELELHAVVRLAREGRKLDNAVRAGVPPHSTHQPGGFSVPEDRHAAAGVVARCSQPHFKLPHKLQLARKQRRHAVVHSAAALQLHLQQHSPCTLAPVQPCDRARLNGHAAQSAVRGIRCKHRSQNATATLNCGSSLRSGQHDACNHSMLQSHACRREVQS
jgi:hypothetical protein